MQDHPTSPSPNADELTPRPLAAVAHALAQPWVICNAELMLLEASDNWLFAYGLAGGVTDRDLRHQLPESHVQAMLNGINNLEAQREDDDLLLAPFENELREFRFLLSVQQLPPLQGDHGLRYLLTLREVSVGLSLDAMRQERRQRDGPAACLGARPAEPAIGGEQRYRFVALWFSRCHCPRYFATAAILRRPSPAICSRFQRVRTTGK